MTLSSDEVLAQSKAAYGQWEAIWDSHAKKNGELYKKLGTSHQQLLFRGVGKTLLLVAYGPSLEKKIDILKEYQSDAVEIACVDKAYHKLVEHGIKVKYVFVADAQVSYENYLEQHIDSTKDVTLLSNVCANPEWSHNWKGPVFFYVNKDNIQSEKRYTEISGCKEVIPASSNVGNSVVVFSTQIFGYDKYLLLGYCYSWDRDSNYYAFGDSDKRWWMSHNIAVDWRGELVETSGNLLFSARWLTDFYRAVAQERNVKIYNCSGQGILEMVPRADLERQLKRAKIRQISDKEKDNVFRSQIKPKMVEKGGAEELNEVVRNYNVASVQVNYIPEGIPEWISTL